MDELKTLPGLGRSPDDNVLATIAQALIKDGTRAAYIDGHPLQWCDRKQLLHRDLSSRIREAGFDIDARRAAPKKAVEREEKRARILKLDKARWAKIAEKPRYILKEAVSFLYDDVSFIDLGEDWGDVQGALEELERFQSSLSRICLQTGRALAIDMSTSHPFFVSPETWQTDRRRRLDGCHFLVTCSLPASLFNNRKGGSVPRTEINAEQEAIRLLELAYADPEFCEKFLLKEVAFQVLQTDLGLSEAGADDRVWGSANVERWKRAGRRSGKRTISESAFRKFISDNQTPQVGD